MITLLLSLTLLQAPDSTGLLIVAHGSDSTWNSAVHRVVEQVKWAGPVRVAFVMGAEASSHSWDAGLSGLEAAGVKRVVIVPFMVSSHGGHVHDIERWAGVRESQGDVGEHAMVGHAGHHSMRSPRVPVVVTAAIDDAAELGIILSERWSALPAQDRARPLVLVAHGPNDEDDAARWVHDIRTATAPLQAALGSRPLQVGLLRDDAPAEVRATSIRALRDSIVRLAGNDSVTVMTVLISTGSINRVTVPTDLRGMPMRYVGAALAPHPALARWVERTASEALRAR